VTDYTSTILDNDVIVRVEDQLAVNSQLDKPVLVKRRCTLSSSCSAVDRELPDDVKVVYRRGLSLNVEIATMRGRVFVNSNLIARSNGHEVR
jgi:hypothetical protein